MEGAKKYVLLVVGVAVGILGGYAYWYFYGCVNGCTITSSWWKMSLYGSLVGYLVFDSINDVVLKRKNLKLK